MRLPLGACTVAEGDECTALGLVSVRGGTGTERAGPSYQARSARARGGVGGFSSQQITPRVKRLSVTC